MNLILAILIAMLVFTILSYGMSVFNKKYFTTHHHVSRKWVATLFPMIIVLFVVITPMTNYLSDHLKELLIYWAAATSCVYIGSNVIKEGLTIKYKGLEITTDSPD